MSGTGKLQLADIRSSLSERDMAILASVQQFKLLTARQIERLHFRDHATPLTAARVCRRALGRLTEQRTLVRLDRRIGGVRAGSASFIYAIGPIGHRILNGDTTRRWSEPSRAFVDHTLATAGFAIELTTETPSGIDLLSVETEPTCWRQYTVGHGSVETLKPDLAVVTADATSEWRWFIEIDLGTESGPAIVRKCGLYDRYWRTGTEQATHDVFPKVVWVTENDSRAKFIANAISKATGLHQPLFSTTARGSVTDLLYGESS